MVLNERMKSLLILSSLLLLAAGCASTNRHQITVGNPHDSLPVREVKVEVNGRMVRDFRQIAPKSQAALKPSRGAPPQAITVSWVDTEGRAHRTTVDTSGDSDFRGQLALEITPANEVTLARIPPVEGELSILPWNTPEAWEGSVMIPGMNDR